jgi:hypothetical protein
MENQTINAILNIFWEGGEYGRGKAARYVRCFLCQNISV